MMTKKLHLIILLFLFVATSCINDPPYVCSVVDENGKPKNKECTDCSALDDQNKPTNPLCNCSTFNKESNKMVYLECKECNENECETKGDMGSTDMGMGKDMDMGMGKDVKTDPIQTRCEPACSNGQVCKLDDFSCVDCLDDSTCGNGFCDVSTHLCVGCLENATCTDVSASACIEGSCGACIENGQCSHLAKEKVCAGGKCVMCVVDSDCNQGEVCNQIPGAEYQTCVAKGSGTQCQSCVSDSECAANHHCVPLDYPTDTAHGYYCLEVGGQGNCKKPWLPPVTGKTSLGGEVGKVYCGVSESLTTCEAVLQGRRGDLCKKDGEDMGDISKCMLQDNGARCDKNIQGNWVCTYTCGGPDDECFRTCNIGGFCN